MTLPIYKMLTEAERHQLLVEWNNTQVEYPQDKCIHQLFEQQVERTPDAVAVVFEDSVLTYRELNIQANQLAHYLQALGVGPEVLVGICVERSLEMVVGLLGILKANGAYVPLDPTYPSKRLAFMLEDASVSVLLTQQRLVERQPKYDAKVVCFDTDWEAIASTSKQNPASRVTTENLAYVIYTSGSTGRPKGVTVSHRAVSRLVVNTNYVNLEPEDVVAQVSNCSFDAATFEIWGALLHGARLVVITKDVALSSQDLAAQIHSQEISVLFLTTALFNQLASVVPWAFNSVRHLLFGGEAVDPKWVKQVLKYGSPKRLLHVYGPTENTTFSSWYLVQDVPQGAMTIPIGRPISNAQIYLLDGNLQPVPIGVPGELYIGGDGLARGYLNHPELTSVAFIPNPFSDLPGSRLYKTGDLASYLADGNIEFLGRIDNQIKIRGFRIELGEIEAVLSQHPEVQQAIIIAREDQPGNRRLAAYIVPNQEQTPTPNTLRRFLKEKLPDYMLPAVFVMLETLPLTLNGKVDRRALPQPDRTCAESEETFVAPRTPIEEVLAEIWAEVLGVEQIGVHDNFFNLGGHSLATTQILTRVRDVFRVELPFDSIFESSTIANLAKIIEQESGENQGWKFPPIQRIPRNSNLLVSFAQEQVCFIHQLAPANIAYQFQATLRLTGQLDVKALQQSLSEIVRRHEIFRTTFPTVDGQPVQVIHQAQQISLPLIDLHVLPDHERSAEAQRHISAEFQKPFDLTQLPLVRWILLSLSAREYVLVHVEHHLVHDGWSFNVFLRELLELYKSFSVGNPSPLPELSIQFADFAHWQRQWMQGEAAQTQLAYWKKKLAGSPPLLELPYDRPRPAVQSYRGTALRVDLPLGLYESLNSVSRQEGVTLFMTMLAAFLTMLHRYIGQNDLCVGSGVANRRLRETEGLIGMIVNILVLRTDLSDNTTFRELLGRVRQVTLEAYAHQDLPFEKVVETLQPTRYLSHNPLVQVVFSFHDAPLPDLEIPGLTIIPKEGLSNGSAKFDLNLVVIPPSKQRSRLNQGTGTEGITIIWEYNTNLFDTETIQQMVGHYQTLLEGIVANPEQRLSNLPVLTTAQQHQFLIKSNDTQTECPFDKCIHQLFEAQVERTPDAVAVVFEDSVLTYRELNIQANQLAHYLQALGVGPEVLVGICVERSLEMVVGLLGILKAGGAYVPLDPAYPQERLAFMLEDAQVSVLLTQQRLIERFSKHSMQIICLDTDWEIISQQSNVNLINEITSENLAYINYTSGSTGQPKGVEVLHRGVIRLLFGVDYVHLDAAQRFLQMASMSFDAFTFEAWGALLHGGRCVILSGNIPTPLELSNTIRKHAITTLWLTAALFNFIVDDNPEALSGIEQLLIGGDALSVTHVQKALESLPFTQIINGYGPTESTTFTCSYPIPKPLDKTIQSIPIGRPIGNTQVYILDAQLQPVPIGARGELYIGGAGLARGYLNCPDLTQEKFIPNPFSNEPNARLYKTGDLVRYLSDGNIQFLGRIDNQVKVRGFRIELGEIEAVLTQHPKVREAVAITTEDQPGNKRLAAYIVPHQESPTTNALRNFLKEKLPDYMVPSTFTLLPTLPLTPNGKVDRNNLPVPDLSDRSLGVNFVEPRTSTEQVLTAIWAETLKLKQVGIHDNFFELGGDSIISIQMVSRAHQAHLQFTPKQLFQHQTIAELATVVSTNTQIISEQGLVTGLVSLTPIQHWFFEQNLQQTHHFNQSILLEVPPDLNPEFLQQVVQQLLRHHDVLRLRFVQEDDCWQQINAACEETVPLSVVNLSGILSAEKQADAIEAVCSELQANLNLSQGPIMRVALFNLGINQAGRLLFIVHHLAVDGVSWRILLEDLATAYQQLSRGEVIQLPPKTTSFQDWAQRLKEYGQSKALAADLDYWLAESRKYVVPLPVDYPSGREDNTIASAAQVSVFLSEEQTRALLQEVPSAYNTQINDVLLTALLQSFAQWTGERSFLVDLEGHGREELFEDVDLSRTVGWFTTIFPVWLDLGEVDHPGEALKSVKEQLRCVPKRGIGYGLLRYLSQDEATRLKLQALPKAEVGFNYLGQFDQVLSADPLLGLAKESRGAQHSSQGRYSHLLEVAGLVASGKLQLNWTYSKNIYQRATVDRLAQGFMEMLKALISHCQSPNVGGYTPSDFSGAKLDQKQLDKFLDKIKKTDRR